MGIRRVLALNSEIILPGASLSALGMCRGGEGRGSLPRTKHWDEATSGILRPCFVYATKADHCGWLEVSRFTYDRIPQQQMTLSIWHDLLTISEGSEVLQKSHAETLVHSVVGATWLNLRSPPGCKIRGRCRVARMSQDEFLLTEYRTKRIRAVF